MDPNQIGLIIGKGMGCGCLVVIVCWLIGGVPAGVYCLWPY